MIKKLQEEVVEWKDGKPWTAKTLSREAVKLNEIIDYLNSKEQHTNFPVSDIFEEMGSKEQPKEGIDMEERFNETFKVTIEKYSTGTFAGYSLYDKKKNELASAENLKEFIRNELSLQKQRAIEAVPEVTCEYCELDNKGGNCRWCVRAIDFREATLLNLSKI